MTTPQTDYCDGLGLCLKRTGQARTEALDVAALREAATEMMLAYRDIEGDVINGRTDVAYDRLRDVLAAKADR